MLVFEIWSILYSTVVNSELGEFLRTWFRNANQWCPITRWLGGFNPLSQLVLGNHWLAFLNQVQVSSSLLTTVEYKIDHISKTNINYTKKTHALNYLFQYIAPFFMFTFFFSHMVMSLTILLMLKIVWDVCKTN